MIGGRTAFFLLYVYKKDYNNKRKQSIEIFEIYNIIYAEVFKVIKFVISEWYETSLKLIYLLFKISALYALKLLNCV